MLLVVTLWDDLVGADGVELSMAAECGVLGEDCDAMDTWLKNWWARSRTVGKEWNGKEEEASLLKSTPIGAAPPKVENSPDEERCHATALRNESGGGRAT